MDKPPRNIDIAVWLLSVSFATWLVPLMWGAINAGSQAIQGSVFVIGMVGVVAIVISGVAAGRGAARIAVSLMIALGILCTPLVWLLMVAYHGHGPDLKMVAFDTLPRILQVYALILIYTKPGSEWFKRPQG